MIQPGQKLAILLAGLAAAACSNASTGPEPLRSTFVLRAVSGAQLPSDVYGNLSGPRYLADTLDFEPTLLASWALPTLERRTALVLPGGQVNRSTEYISFEQEGDVLSFRLPCGPDTDCAIGFLQGTLNGTWLEITLPAPFRSPLLYERLE